MGLIADNGDICLRDHSDFFVGATFDGVVSAVAVSLSSALGNWEKLCIQLIVNRRKGAPFNILLGRAAGIESHENDIG